MNAPGDTMGAVANSGLGLPASKKILLVDDDPAIRRILMRLLTEENYEVRSAADGEEALTMASEAPFDLVLLDLSMPVKDGWQTLQELAARNPALPVILITARPNQVFSALAAGVAALLEKPLDLTRLFRTIRGLLEESPEARLARLKGQAAEFRYVPPAAEDADSNSE